MKNSKKGVLPLVGVLSVFALIAPVLTACATDDPIKLPESSSGSSSSTTATETQPGGTSSQTATSTEPVDLVPTIRWTNKVKITAGAEGTGTATEEGITTTYTKFDTTNKDAHVTLGLTGSMKSTARIKCIDSVTVKFSENSIIDNDGLGTKAASASLVLKTSFKNNEAGPMSDSKALVSGQKVEFTDRLPDAFEIVYKNNDDADERNADAKCVIESVIVTYTEEERYGMKIDANASYDTYLASYADGVYTRGDKVPNLTILRNFKAGTSLAFKSPEDKDAKHDHTFNFDNVTFTGTDATGHAKVGEEKYETIYVTITSADVLATIVSPEPVPYPEDEYSSVGKYDLYNTITGEKSVLETTKFGKVKLNDKECGTFTDENPQDPDIKFSLDHEEKLTVTAYGNILVFRHKVTSSKEIVYVGGKQAADQSITYTTIAKDSTKDTALTIFKATVGAETKVFAINPSNSGSLIEIDGTKIKYTANNEDLTLATEINLSETVATEAERTMTNVFRNGVFEDKVEGGKRYGIKLTINEERIFSYISRGNYAGTYKTTTGDSTLVLDGFGNYDLDGKTGTHEEPKFIKNRTKEVVIDGVTYRFEDINYTFAEYVAPKDTLISKSITFVSDKDPKASIVLGEGNAVVTDKYTGYKPQTCAYKFADDVYTFDVKVNVEGTGMGDNYTGNKTYSVKLSTGEKGNQIKIDSGISVFFGSGWDGYTVDLYSKGDSFTEPFSANAVTFTGAKENITLAKGKATIENGIKNKLVSPIVDYTIKGNKIIMILDFKSFDEIANFEPEEYNYYGGKVTATFTLSSDLKTLTLDEDVILMSSEQSYAPGSQKTMLSVGTSYTAK